MNVLRAGLAPVPDSSLFARVAELAGIGLFRRDLQNDRGEWSDHTFRLYGFDPLSHKGLAPTRAQLLERIHPEDRARFLSEWFAPAHASNTRAVEARVLHPNGTVRHLYSYGIVERDGAGQPAQILGIIIDVTGQRVAERQASEALARLQLATSSADLGTFVRELASDIGYWDAAVFRMFGLEAADHAPTRQQILHTVHPDDRATYIEAWRNVQHAATFLNTEIRTVHRDGSQHWVLIRGRRDGNRVAGVALDITAQKRAEKEMQEALVAKAAAERASRAKTEFLSRMSHELRTPLNAILGFAQLMELEPGDPLSAGQRAKLDQIQKAGWHLLALINEVLDLSRIEAGGTKVELTPVVLEPLIGECIALTQADALRRGIVISHSFGPQAPARAAADTTRLKQVLLNLLSNAVKYNRDGGRIGITVVATGDGRLAISISDTGRGMTPAQQAQLFEPFNRLGLETSHIEGTGMGLAISKKLVGLMRGELRVASKPNVGSEFVVVLSAAAPAALPDLFEPAERRLEARSDIEGNVLYVEDSAPNVAVVRQLLALRPRVKLFTAVDGASARELADVCEPRVILTSMHLPDVDGKSLLHGLRSNPGLAATPYVALSGDVLPNQIEEARRAGFAAYWTKPLDAAEFLRGIDGFLSAAGGTGNRGR